MQLLIEFSIRFLVFPCFFIVFPQFHKRHEFRLRMREFFVGESCFVLLVVRTQARILHRQCRSNDQYFGKARFTLTGQQHACDRGIDRKLGQLPTQRGESFIRVDGTQLEELSVAIFDHA